MIIPDWLFIVLAVVTVTLLLILLSCLVCVCVNHKKRKSQTFSGKKKGKKHPELSFVPYEEPKYTYLPYTTAYTVQGNNYRSNSVAGSTCSDVPFYSPPGSFLQASRRKADALDKTPNQEERYQTRSLPDPRRTPLLQTQVDGRLSSRPSSRRSSIGSMQSQQTEENQMAKGIYLHSTLTQSNAVEPVDQEAVISYDQDFFENKSLKQNGRLEFALYYDPQATELVVTIKRALNLPPEEGKDFLNPYVNFCIVPEDFYWQRTNIVENTLNPIYNETFHIADVLHHKLREYSVCFFVMNSDRIHGDRAIGKVMVSLSDLRAGVNIEMKKEISI